MTVSDERLKALDAAMAKIDKDWGAMSVYKLGTTGRLKIEAIPSGVLSMDLALKFKGWPKGRIVEVYGPEAAGKTLLTTTAIAAVQKAGGIAGIIDAENAFSPDWAKTIGVDLDTLVFSQPTTGESALEIAETLIRSGALDILVIDSVAALVPKKELEGDMGDSQVGAQARMMSQAMRKLSGAISASGTTVFFINQLREKVGVMFGSPETTPGGKALKYYASTRIDVRKIETLKDTKTGEQIGQRVRAKVIKNKVAPPGGVAEYVVLFTEGISRTMDILELGVKHLVVKKAGAFYDIYGVKAQGSEKARAYLQENPDVLDRIEREVKEIVLGPEDGNEIEPTVGAAEAPAE
jgi:recombination protein RecA